MKTRVKTWWARRSVRITFQILLVVLVFLVVRAWTQRDLASGIAPPLQGRLLDGSEFRLMTKRDQPLLLHFWASWCPVCRLEQETIDDLAQDYPVITVAMQSGSGKEVRAFLRKQGLDFPVLNDPDGTLAQRFGVRAVPTSFVIDTDNRIVFREAGYTTSAGLRLRLWWAR